jgi:four helix bundle protein
LVGSKIFKHPVSPFKKFCASLVKAQNFLKGEKTMLTNFRTYQLALNFYKLAKTIPLAPYLRDQLLRASSSIVLNLAEGSAKPTKKDRIKFYCIAFGSLREVQAITEMENIEVLKTKADHLGACIFKLTTQ